MTDWSELRAYSCRFCNWDCINERNTELTQERVCRTCRPYLTLSEDGRPSVKTVLEAIHR